MTDHTAIVLMPSAHAAANLVRAACGQGNPCCIHAAIDIPARAVVIAAPCDAGALLAHTASPAVVFWLADGVEPVCETLAHPAVAGTLAPTDAPSRVATTLAIAAARAGTGEAAVMLEKVLAIGRALAAEKDLDTLLALILTHARELTGADGASIYTRDADGVLYFRMWQNASLGGATNVDRRPVGENSIAGYVARVGQPLLIDDVYAIDASQPYHFNADNDRRNNYRTRSLLNVPLTNKANEVVGVLQLINCKADPGARLSCPADVATMVRAFDARDLQLAQALAGQAGIALENSRLYADIERLFEGFIKASVQAIEARDPTTAGHSFRVADFTERLALAVDRSEAAGLRDTHFSRERLREIRYAALLHDFGKVGVREEVLVKAKKLYPHQMEIIKHRFRQARLHLALDGYRTLVERHADGEISHREFRKQKSEMESRLLGEHERLDRYLHVVMRANEPTILHASAPEELREIMGYLFEDGDGPSPLLQPFEFSGLALPKGSLSAEERVEIESHVTHTFAFLSLIPWTRDLSRLPEFAYAHHEKLDGSGYPRGLRNEAIPLPARMMTIADIYDALTAPDRPYKLAVGEERALDILGSEARAGKIDAQLLSLFIDSGAWRLSR
jgi:HD-GYP domain-containing protein (c-di-GMP phosphodiesterase class II)